MSADSQIFSLAGYSADALIDELTHRVILRSDELRPKLEREPLDEPALALAIRLLGEYKGESEIYFIRPGGLDFVKIGTCPKTGAVRRMQSLQTAWPLDLELLVSIPGVECGLELAFHGCFNRHRIRGEWFKYDRTISSFVEHCKAVADKRNKEMLDDARIRMAEAQPCSR